MFIFLATKRSSLVRLRHYFGIMGIAHSIKYVNVWIICNASLYSIHKRKLSPPTDLKYCPNCTETAVWPSGHCYFNHFKKKSLSCQLVKLNNSFVKDNA